MYFLIFYLITGFTCSTLCGYALMAFAAYPSWVNTAIYIGQLVAWFLPILIWILQNKNILPLRILRISAQISYFLLGFVFLLFAVVMLCDFVWYFAYFLVPKGLLPAPFEATAARTANLLVLVFLLLMSAYGLYAAHKMPRILRYGYRDARIKRPLKVLVISDWHITRMILPQSVAQRVEYINSLNPDVILMPGDIADDAPDSIKAHLSALRRLRAKEGIYYTLGNHEIYHNPFLWESTFAALGWRVLHNSGAVLSDSGVYIGGVPDTGGFSANVSQSVKNAAKDTYRIVLSHQPSIVAQTKEGEVDLMVSGHTHGGQIAPFNLISKLGNSGFAAGEYRIKNTVLLVSRGIGYWGPPMRLGAPSDVLLINLETRR